MEPYLAWIIVGLALAIVEILSGTFYLLILGIAAFGGAAILHVIAGVRREMLVKGVIDHMAFSGTDLAGGIARLKAKCVPHELRRLPGYGTWQLFFHDPNGAKVEIDFDSRETAPA